MSNLFILACWISLQAGGMTLLVMLIRYIFKNIPRKYICLLWGTVGLRLAVPFTVQFRYSPVESHVSTMSVSSAEKSVGLDWSLINVLTIVWIVGILIFLGKNVYAYLSIKGKVSFSVPTQLYVGGTFVKVYKSENIDTPFIFGIINPKIYVPYNLEYETYEYLVSHELIHIKNHDNITKILSNLLLGIYWFNPLIWLACHYFSCDIEMSVDDSVILMHKDDIQWRKGYANAILTCCSYEKHHMYISSLTGFSGLGVKERIENVMRDKKKKVYYGFAAGIVCAILILIFMTTRPANLNIDVSDSPDNYKTLDSNREKEAEDKLIDEINKKIKEMESVITKEKYNIDQTEVERVNEEKYVESYNELKEKINDYNYAVEKYSILPTAIAE